MAAHTAPTSGTITEFSGGRRLLPIRIACASNADTLDCSLFGMSTPEIVVANIVSGLDAAFTMVMPSISDSTITFNGLKADGATGADSYDVIIDALILGS